LSKGHAAPLLYAAMAEAGYFPKAWLLTLRKLNSPLQGHPEVGKLAGVEMSAGPLGHGLSFGNGIALAARLDKKPYRVYVLMSDGEMDAGETWEAAMASAHFRLDNVTAFVDRNRLQNDGPTEEIMRLEPLAEKWQAFGWKVIEIDGHSFPEIFQALDTALVTKEQPTVIIAHTVKGKGVSFMENVADFHGKAPTPEQVVQALEELGEG